MSRPGHHLPPSRTPIFTELAQRYTTRGGWKSTTPEEWALGAYMRGVLYGIVLQEVLLPVRRTPLANRAHFAEPWHHDFTPSPWDPIDVVPNKHDPTL